MPTDKALLPGIKIIENKRFADERGFFEEYYNERKSHRDGIDVKFVQVNHSLSSVGVIRGLHYQKGQGKLVGVTRGRIWDVAVDIRPDSPTRGQHFGIELNEKSPVQLWIPSGFAHGFCVLGDEPADVLYLVDAFYDPKLEKGIVWNDPDLAIPWPVDLKRAVISDRDQALPSWAGHSF